MSLNVDVSFKDPAKDRQFLGSQVPNGSNCWSIPTGLRDLVGSVGGNACDQKFMEANSSIPKGIFTPSPQITNAKTSGKFGQGMHGPTILLESNF